MRINNDDELTRVNIELSEVGLDDVALREGLHACLLDNCLLLRKNRKFSLVRLISSISNGQHSTSTHQALDDANEFEPPSSSK